MAVKAGVRQFTAGVEDEVQIWKWAGLTGTDTGEPLKLPQHRDRTWQTVGNHDTGTVAFQGSLDGGTTWFALTNVADGLAAATATAGGKATNENALAVRPVITGGGASSSVDVYVIVAAGRKYL